MKASSTGRSGGPKSWRPLLRVSSVTWLGESDEGTLWIGSDPGVRRQLDLDRLIACLPLLERPYVDVLDELTSAVASCGPTAGDALHRVVPGVIETALASESEYWLRGACAWVEALGPSEQALDWARRLETATAASQSTRHAARRLRTRWSAAE